MATPDEQVQIQLIIEAVASGFDTVKAQIEAITKEMTKQQQKLQQGVGKTYGSGGPIGEFFGGGAEWNQAASNINKTADASENAGFKFTELRSKILLAKMVLEQFAEVAKIAYNAAAEGAGAEQMIISWERLLDIIGAAPDVLDSVRAAARGTVDDFTMMSSLSLLAAGSSKEFSKTLMEHAPELMQIAKAASILNPQLGDTAYMFDSIARGIKRTSPLILDNLGIIVRQKEAHEKYAASIGVAVDELDAEQRKTALLLEVLETGKNIIDQVGGSTESLVDPFEQAQAATTNLGRELKIGLIDTATPIVNTFNVLVSGALAGVQAMNELNRAVREGSITPEEANKIKGELMWTAAYEGADAMEDLRQAQALNSQEAQKMASDFYTEGEAINYFVIKAKEAGIQISSLQDEELFSGFFPDRQNMDMTRDQLEVIVQKLREGAVSADDFRAKAAAMVYLFDEAGEKKIGVAMGSDPTILKGFTEWSKQAELASLSFTEKLDIYNSAMRNIDIVLKEYGIDVSVATQGQQQLYEIQMKSASGANDYSDALAKEAAALANYNKAVNAAIEAGTKAGLEQESTKMLKDYMQQLTGLKEQQIELTRETDVWNDVMANKSPRIMKKLGEEIKVLQDRLARFREKGISPTSEEYKELEETLATKIAQVDWQKTYGVKELQDLNDALEENKRLQEEAAKAIKDATTQMIYQTMAAGLDAETNLDLARKMGLISEQDYAIAYTMSMIQSEYDKNKDGAIDAAEAALGYNDAILVFTRVVTGLQSAGFDTTLDNMAKASENLFNGLEPLSGFVFKTDFSTLDPESALATLEKALEAAKSGATIDLSGVPIAFPDMEPEEMQAWWQDIITQAFSGIQPLAEPIVTFPELLDPTIGEDFAGEMDKFKESLGEVKTSAEETATPLDDLYTGILNVSDGEKVSTDPIDNLATSISTLKTNSDEAATIVDLLKQAIDRLQDKTVTVTVKYINENEPGGAMGLDMIVPAGYPNDTFPVFATSGERVKISKNTGEMYDSRDLLRPANAEFSDGSALGGGGFRGGDRISTSQEVKYVNNTNYFYTDGAAAMALSQQQLSRKSRISKGMR